MHKGKRKQGKFTVPAPVAAKLATANAVLATFAPVELSRRRGGIYVSWEVRGKRVSRRWMCRGQDFYPVWDRHYPGGGTSVTALSQLVRWVRGQPVLPAASWRYWASDTCKLLPSAAVDALLAGGYPEHADCVLCGEPISGKMDWWRQDGLSGPCCGWTTGCRQKKAVVVA